MTRQISEAGLLLIKEAEGLRLKPYQDSGGVWTIGFGHTRNVTADTHPITEDAATELLIDDLSHAEAEIERHIRVTLTDNQFAALVSLVFNTGTAPLLLTLGHKLNAGDYAGAADEFMHWSHVDREVMPGLLRRRGLERGLFLRPAPE